MIVQVAKLKRDVDAGLSVVVFADWYNVSVMKKASLDGLVERACRFPPQIPWIIGCVNISYANSRNSLPINLHI